MNTCRREKEYSRLVSFSRKTDAISILEKNLNKINWYKLSINIEAISILENRFARTHLNSSRKLGEHKKAQDAGYGSRTVHIIRDLRKLSSNQLQFIYFPMTELSRAQVETCPFYGRRQSDNCNINDPNLSFS